MVVIFQLKFRESITVWPPAPQKKYPQDKSIVTVEEEFVLTLNIYPVWVVAYLCLANPGDHLSNVKRSSTEKSVSV